MTKSTKVKKVSVFPSEMKKSKAKKKAPSDPARDAKLRAFKSSDVAERDGVSLNADGSIMRRSESLSSSSDHEGQVRSSHGVSKREPIYNHGFNSPKLRGSVAKKKPKKSPAKRNK